MLQQEDCSVEIDKDLADGLGKCRLNGVERGRGVLRSVGLIGYEISWLVDRRKKALQGVHLEFLG